MNQLLSKKMKTTKNNKGFTLIELIVVIAILGILAAIAIPRLSGLQDGANKKQVLSNLKMIDNAVQVVAADKNIDVATIEEDNTDLLVLVPNWPDTTGVTYTVDLGVVKATVGAAAGIPGLTDGAVYDLSDTSDLE